MPQQSFYKFSWLIETTAGLERITALLAALEQPQRSVPFIHVAGTNGKGSTSAFLSAIYRQAGLHVGVFSSPHFLHPRDAIRVDGYALSLEAWQQWRSSVDDAANTLDAPPTEFERETAAAWLVFREARVDIAIIECGLGGRLDATNAGDPKCTPKLASVITAIGLDHQRLLGDTTEAIASEKAGIFLPHHLVVLAFQSDTAANRTLIRTAKQLNCKLIHDTTAATWNGPPINGNVLVMRSANESLNINPGLVGDSQLVNLATAIATVDALKTELNNNDQSLSKQLIDKLSSITDQDIVKGASNTRWPWRLEWLTVPPHLLPSVTAQQSIRLLVDGAHNPDAARLLRRYVDIQLSSSTSSSSSNRHVYWIIGMGADKDLPSVLGELVHPGDRVCAVPFTQPIAMPWVKCRSPTDIAAIAAATLQSTSTSIVSMPDVKTALHHFLAELDYNDWLLVVCGSLYLAADVYRLFERTVDHFE
ncbi:Mur ligase [Syncephalis fuscata]|nr:Mur ligase [Syncephalis fuscata]